MVEHLGGKVDLLSFDEKGKKDVLHPDRLLSTFISYRRDEVKRLILLWGFQGGSGKTEVVLAVVFFQQVTVSREGKLMPDETSSNA